MDRLRHQPACVCFMVHQPQTLLLDAPQYYTSRGTSLDESNHICAATCTGKGSFTKYQGQSVPKMQYCVWLLVITATAVLLLLSVCRGPATRGQTWIPLDAHSIPQGGLGWFVGDRVNTLRSAGFPISSLASLVRSHPSKSNTLGGHGGVTLSHQRAHSQLQYHHRPSTEVTAPLVLDYRRNQLPVDKAVALSGALTYKQAWKV